jgi:hypothetical protein
VTIPDLTRYPEVVTSVMGRDRPYVVEKLPNEMWRVTWRRGVMSSHVQDPRPDLLLGCEPRGVQCYVTR